MIFYYKLQYFVFTKNTRQILHYLPTVEKYDFPILNALFKLNNDAIHNNLFSLTDFREIPDRELGWIFQGVMDTLNINLIDKFLALDRDVFTHNNIHHIVAMRNLELFNKLFKDEFLDERVFDTSIAYYNEEVFDAMLKHITPAMINSHHLIHAILNKDHSTDILDKLLPLCSPHILTHTVLYYAISTKQISIINRILDKINPAEISEESVRRIASEYAPFIPELSVMIPPDKQNIQYLINSRDIDRIIQKIPHNNYEMNIICDLIRLNDYKVFRTIVDNRQFTVKERQYMTRVIVFEQNTDFMLLSIGVVINSDMLFDCIQTKNVDIFNKLLFLNEHIIDGATLYTAVCFYQKDIINRVFEYPHLITTHGVCSIIRRKYIHLLYKVKPFIIVTESITNMALNSLSRRIMDIILSKETKYVSADMLCRLVYATRGRKLVEYIITKYNLKVYNDELIVLLVQRSCFTSLKNIFENNEVDVSLLNYSVRYFPIRELSRNSRWIKPVIGGNKKMINLILHQNKALIKYMTSSPG